MVSICTGCQTMPIWHHLHNVFALPQMFSCATSYLTEPHLPSINIHPTPHLHSHFPSSCLRVKTPATWWILFHQGWLKINLPKKNHCGPQVRRVQWLLSQWYLQWILKIAGKGIYLIAVKLHRHFCSLQEPFQKGKAIKHCHKFWNAWNITLTIVTSKENP